MIHFALFANDDLVLQEQGVKIFLISGSVKDISTLFVALTHRLEAVKKSTSCNKSPAVKRKLPASSQEEPPEKKDAKLDDDKVKSDE